MLVVGYVGTIFSLPWVSAEVFDTLNLSGGDRRGGVSGNCSRKTLCYNIVNITEDQEKTEHSIPINKIKNMTLLQNGKYNTTLDHGIPLDVDNSRLFYWMLFLLVLGKFFLAPLLDFSDAMVMKIIKPARIKMST